MTMKKKIVFLHPDFGIGGAERLVLDAALATKSKGHQVHIVTNQFSEQHCFTELKEEFGENIEVVAQQKVPRSIFGKCYALCAYFRICLAAFFICYKHRDADVIFCDQISAPLPILRLLTRSSLLFYCHFPDQLLTARDTFWKKCYRFVIDRIESWTMLCAHKILVNSHFTEGVVRDTFPMLRNRPLTILSPSINCEFFDKQIKRTGAGDSVNDKQISMETNDGIDSQVKTIFLSLNRFERKKCIELAIHSFDYLCKHSNHPEIEKECALVIAGGYDPLNAENIAYFDELKALVGSLGLQQNVHFIKSPDDLTKCMLIDKSSLTIYTPDREHFGIVPLESMYLKTPVLAVDSGGPKETVLDGQTGFLRPADPKSFAEVMLKVATDPDYSQELGEKGREHVLENFSFDAFADKLDGIIESMHRRDQQE